MSPCKTAILAAICLALLVARLPVFAQDAQPAAAPTTAATTQAGAWGEVADGIWAVKVPRFPEDKKEKVKPEFAVLRLSEARYDEFQKEHVGFLNKYKIFSRPVNKQEVGSAAKPQKEKAEEAAYWYLICAHWPTSTVACQAYPGWSEPEKLEMGR